MCGIAGELRLDNAPADEHWCRSACQIMAHRGPDGDGFYRSKNVVLGHRRLSIIDLAGGSQPMSYGGRYWITYNGEIYNYRELRSELTAQGCEFRTSSDTEVILAAYAAWGTDSFVRLDGIFAFAIWDDETGELIVVRDHLGVKPLLYSLDGDSFRFASEFKALLTHGRLRREIDTAALQDYLTLGYVITPRTLVKGVAKLPPATYLRIVNGQVEQRSYWNLAQYASQPLAADSSEEAQIEHFSRQLQNTVASQMVSDVPVGAFLSGGIDSSSIVAFAAGHTKRKLKTFSIGFGEATFSELDYADEAARALGSEHYQHVVTAPTFDELQHLIWLYDEPLGDTSLIPTYYVAKLAREQVTVSLSGDGGDELLAGYDTYVADKLQGFYRRLPRALHKGIGMAVNAIPASYGKVSLDFKLKQFVAQAHHSPERAHFGWRSMWSDETAQAMTGGTSPDYSPFSAYLDHYANVEDAPSLHRALYVDMKTWMLDDILTKVDRASMACSLEARVPFLSPRFVEFAMQLPPHVKLRGFERKYILKRAMRNTLPPSIISRKKRGFNAPVSSWMRGEWRESIEALWRENDSQMVDLQAPSVQTAWREHLSGERDHGFRLWTLLSLLLWEQKVYRMSQSEPVA